MRRFVAAGLLAVVLAFSAGSAAAVSDEYDDTQSHPLRVAAYLIYPLGFTAEWLVFRPFHYLVSRPYLEQVFGHYPHQEVGTYH
ncbi:MAG TPA: hypothetical protein VF515_11345 [Candidatus Binatia bacterium]